MVMKKIMRFGSAAAAAALLAGVPAHAAHVHGPECYDRILSCSMDEGDTEIIGGEQAHDGPYEDSYVDGDGNIVVTISYPALSALARPHAHGDGCYSAVLSCGQNVDEDNGEDIGQQADDDGQVPDAPAARIDMPEDGGAFLGAMLGAAGLLFMVSAI